MKQATNRRPSGERGSTEASDRAMSEEVLSVEARTRRPNVRTRVLYLITKATSGGAQKYVFDLATNLPKNEFKPIVSYGTRGKLVEDLATAGIETRVLPSLARDVAVFSDIKSFFDIYRALKEIRPDVVHLNSSKAAALGALASCIAGVPKIIFTVHGWPFKEDRNMVSRTFIRLISWFTALLSHYVIVVSRTDEDMGKRMMGIKKKVCFVGLGLAPFQTLPPHDAFRVMFGSLKPADLRSSTLRLVTIAELTANKGLRHAIDAVAILSERNIDAIYVIAGNGEERGALQAYATKIGVGDRVFLPGFVANARENLSGFDVFVLPSIKEGTPYVLLEAVFAGLPIVATSAIDQDLVAQVSNVRLVPPKDALALADAITELSKLPRTTANRANAFSLPEMVQDTV